MARPDPISVLRTIQRIATGLAKERLAAAGRQLESARQVEVDARTRMATERREAPVAEFAAWLPTAQVELSKTVTRERDAIAEVAAALAAAVRARLSEQVLAAEASRRRAAARTLRRKKEQVLLEDLRPAALNQLGS
jgi:hypothetical protein